MERRFKQIYEHIIKIDELKTTSSVFDNSDSIINYLDKIDELKTEIELDVRLSRRDIVTEYGSCVYTEDTRKRMMFSGYPIVQFNIPISEKLVICDHAQPPHILKDGVG